MRIYVSESEKDKTSLVSSVHSVTLLDTVVKPYLVHSPREGTGLPLCTPCGGGKAHRKGEEVS